MKPRQLSADNLSKYLGVPLSRITEIIKETRGITADTATRLAKFFGTSPEFWLNLQAQHDLSKIQFEKTAEMDAIPSCASVANQIDHRA